MVKKILIGIGVVIAIYLVYRFVWPMVAGRLGLGTPPISGAASGPSAGRAPLGAIQANFSSLKQTSGGTTVAKIFNPSFKPFGAK